MGMVKIGDRLIKKQLYEVILADEDAFVVGKVKGNSLDYRNAKIYSNNESVLPLSELGFEKMESKILYARMEHPENGYGSDKDKARKLDPELYYVVDEVSMGQSYTYITLWVGKRKKSGFNSVNFEFYDKDLKPIDIFKMPEYNPYL